MIKGKKLKKKCTEKKKNCTEHQQLCIEESSKSQEKNKIKILQLHKS